MELIRRYRYAICALAAAFGFAALVIHCAPKPTSRPDLTHKNYGASLITPDAAVVSVDSAPAVSSSIFNVLSYGAVGDGLADDRAAIISAWNAACSAGGGEVYLPCGTYRVTKAGANVYELLAPCGNVILAGASRGCTTIISQTGLPSVTETLKLDNVSNIVIRDLTIDGAWGNAVTTVTDASHGAILPQSTINVVSTAGFPQGAVTFTLINSHNQTQAISCTGPQTATTFIGCSGGTGFIGFDNVIGWKDVRAGAGSGINHTDQTDPQNLGIMMAGVTNVTVQDVSIQNMYGDCLWAGGTSSARQKPGSYIHVLHSSCIVAARQGFTIGGGISKNIHVDDYTVKYVGGAALDCEPIGGGYMRDVTIENSHLEAWWNPQNNFGYAINLVGGGTDSNANPYNDTKRITIAANTILGGIDLAEVRDITVFHNTLTMESSTSGAATIQIQNADDDITVDDNTIYNRSGFNGINLTNDGGSPTSARNAKITGNKIHVRNAGIGIDVIEPGGSTLKSTGTATAVTVTTLTDTNATWILNQWIGFMVQIGTSQAVVQSNTACPGTCILTLKKLQPNGSGPITTSAWMTYTGRPTDTPAVGTYVIADIQGFIDVAGNMIDGFDDGNGTSGDGIYVQNAQSANSISSGSRVRVSNNRISNVGTNGIHVFTTAGTPWVYLEISDNKIDDTRTSPVTTTAIDLERAVGANVIVMRGNQSTSAITNLIGGTGYASGLYWMEGGGAVQSWAGFGTPVGNVTAPPGSIYRSVTAGSGTTFYIHDGTGTDNTGWTALSGNVPFAPDIVSQLSMVGEDYDANFAGTNGAFAAGTLWMAKVRVYASSFSKVMLMVRGTNEASCTSVFVAIYKSDGTQSSSMATATVDAISQFASGSSPRAIVVTLTNSVTGLNVGDDVYVAVLPTGSCSPTISMGVPTTTFPNGNLSPSNGLRSGQFSSGLSSAPGSVTLSSMTAAGTMFWAAVL